MGASASLAFDARGHLLVLTRGAQPFFEFDENGTFIRTFGDNLFTRAHGVRLDADGNIWATDVGAHRRLQAEPAGTGAAHARHERRGRRVERGGGIPQVESTE